ncbi:MAG: Fur family transcriptional regulator [Gemmatimonadales bacterium]|nr:Fur family transcriptional regulator [Gemmatimonadales bacterium]
MPDRVREGNDLLEQFRRWLRDRHQPITQQRDQVAQAVFAAGGHLSVDEIAQRVRDRGHHVGIATVYRSLEALVKSGLVRAHDFGEGFKRYEPLLSPAQHGHLICTRCGRVKEFSTERFERMLPMVADEHGFLHHHHRVELHGLCKPCREGEFGALAASRRRS